MLGWCEDDLTFFTDSTIKTPEETYKFVSSYVHGLTRANMDKLLSLYPVSDFVAYTTSALSSEFFRSARIFRDILMTCPPMWYGKQMAKAGKDVYLFDWNQTILEPIIEQQTEKRGWGSVHTSEFAYIFGNLSHYDVNGNPFHPTPADYALTIRGSRSLSTFAATGRPGLDGHDTFRGFKPAYATTTKGRDDVYVFVAGGPSEGLSAIDGQHSTELVRAQKLRERCAFINSPEIVEQLRY
ncbi:hypothetical protein C8A00DRAFT_36223 [Chaetomidium leptoderma]|uniref:Carboxylesterase type B domain-containing protein n=1 Tax=Chaetomidium leptoderma TaxID=669021 RepID=A0AAN6ZU88_9PEZI|nr:hypothetical protein C8A00DRAFT_36223 [Chaetomidium leptoderma]